MVTFHERNPKVIIFTGPSGGGKTTLSKYILHQDLGIERSVSATTRFPRSGEREGVDYYFLSEDDFDRNIAENGFVEWQQVYEGLYYGTLKQEVERIWTAGKIVLFVVDVEGAKNLKKYFGEQAISLFVMAPSLKVLAQRLYTRGTDDDLSIQKRLKKAEKELDYEKFSDVVIINDKLKDAKVKVDEIIGQFLKK